MSQPHDPETQLTEAKERLQAVEAQLDESQRTISHLERRQKIDALLAESDTIDLEAARLLTQCAVEAMDEPDVAAAVADLKRHKPYLFRHRRADSAGAMAARDAPAADDAQDAAERAMTSGDRRDLLRYLRLRRP